MARSIDKSLLWEDDFGSVDLDWVAISPDAASVITGLREKIGSDGDDSLRTWLGKRRGALAPDVSMAFQGVRDVTCEFARDKINIPESIKAQWPLIASAKETDNTLMRLVSPPAFADTAHLQKQVDKVLPAVRQWIAHQHERWLSDECDDFTLSYLKALEKFDRNGGQVSEGPTILAYADPANLGYFLQLKGELEGLDKPALAAAFIEDMKRVTDPGYGTTAMHRDWGKVDGGYELVESEQLSDFIYQLDSFFGTDQAVPMAAELLALEDKKGRKPLRRAFEGAAAMGPTPKETRMDLHLYRTMVKNLQNKLGDDDKFTRYMDEAIIPNLPRQYGGGWPKQSKSTNAIVDKYLARAGIRPGLD